MLKRKLEQQTAAIEQTKAKLTSFLGAANSEMFSQPLWMSFYEIERKLNEQLSELSHPSCCTHAYNPVEYAASLHCAYLRKYLTGRKEIIFVGMNPGPNGMGQTGVPFGNVNTVRDTMQLSGEVLQPPVVHSKRPVNGLNCKIQEPSGVRLWKLFERLAGGSLDTFFRQCFVHNFCPLAFFDEAGHNITPTDLKGEFKKQIRDICLAALDELLNLVQPQTVVAVGDYVYTALKKSSFCRSVSVIRLAHPSPRSKNNTNWDEKASSFLDQHGLVKFMRGEIKDSIIKSK